MDFFTTSLIIDLLCVFTDLRHTGHMSAENRNLNGSKSDRTRPNAVHNLDHTTKTSNKFFLNPNHTVVLAQIGATATLHCEPSHLGDSTVILSYITLYILRTSSFITAVLCYIGLPKYFIFLITLESYQQFH